METPPKEEVPADTKNQSSNDAPEPKPEYLIETVDSASTDTEESFDGEAGEGDAIPLLPFSKLKHQWTNATDATATSTQTQTPTITPIGSTAAVPDIFDLTDEDDDDIATSDEAETSDSDDEDDTTDDSVVFTEDDEDEDAVNEN